MFKVVYKYSACISINTDDITILCDPWFEEAYEGTWIQYPKINSYPEYIGDFDVVYISHIHPDHYDAKTFLISMEKNKSLLQIGGKQKAGSCRKRWKVMALVNY